MQRPQHLSRTSSSEPDSSSIDLKFPTIPVHGTPATWGSHSQLVKMNSNHDESGDETTSSLGDSSYDFVQDRSDVTSDDEDQDAMTESTTSSDEHAFEQVQPSSQEIEQRNPTEQRSQIQNTACMGTDQGSSAVNKTLSGADSSDTFAHLTSQSDNELIEFEEPSITNLNSSRFTEVSHTLKVFDAQNQSVESRSGPLEHLQGSFAVTVRQTMTSHSLRPKDGQYKIMYVGDVAMRESIVHKIGTALAAGLKTTKAELETPRSSKFNVVPISAFGEESSPDIVLIDSSGLELTVEDCNSAEFAQEDCGNDTLRLDLSGGITVHSRWNGSKFVLNDDWRLPDLAIFCLPDKDNISLRKARQFAKSFMCRHKVPSIAVSQSSTWESPVPGPITLDYLTPHICLESRKPSLVHAQVVRRYPIDLATFINIDAGQLNRNLASLAAASCYPKSQQREQLSTSKAKKFSSRDWSGQDLFESLVTDVRKDGIKGLNRYEYIAGFAVVLISLLGIVVGGLGLWELLGASRVSTSRVFPAGSPASDLRVSRVSTIPRSSLTSSSSFSVFTPIASSTPSISTHSSLPKSLSPKTDLASFLLDAYTLAPNKSEQFKVHVLGDSHIVLRLPHWFNRLRKSPKLLFKILRGGRELEFHTTTLFDGVFALQVPREDAYGIMKVEIWTESKPIVHETFDVDFGSPWLKMSGWKQTNRLLTERLRGDIHSVQISVSSVYDYTRAGLSIFMQQQRKSFDIRRSAGNFSKAKAIIANQTRNFQRTLSRSLFASKAAVTQKASPNFAKLTEDLAFYYHDNAYAISRRTRRLVRTLPKMVANTPVTNLGKFGRRHLRETQKRTLKLWWSLRGVPEQKRVQTGDSIDGNIKCCFS